MTQILFAAYYDAAMTGAAPAVGEGVFGGHVHYVAGEHRLEHNVAGRWLASHDMDVGRYRLEQRCDPCTFQRTHCVLQQRATG